jgi:MOSC domain-containing protein YiiM
VKEVGLPEAPGDLVAATFRASLATILELPFDDVPEPQAGEDPAASKLVGRRLGGLGIGLVPIAGARSFSWAGPWLARLQPPEGEPRFLVMYGVPSGPVWDPGGDGQIETDWIEAGYVVAAADIALARPAPATAPVTAGVLEAISVAPSAGEAVRALDSVRALAGRGLDGDRYVAGGGTFPSGLPGSALTLIEAEVCESFAPALNGDDHRRNVVTRGIDLNRLVGHEFMLGDVRCRGMRLCEPCTVIQRYARRQIIRPLVHRGGLRADILTDGEIRVGDRVGAPSYGNLSTLLALRSVVRGFSRDR